MIPLKVSCYSGYKANERPTAVEWKGEKREVVDITDCAFCPGSSSFKVVLEGGARLFLQYDHQTDSWEGREIPAPGGG